MTHTPMTCDEFDALLPDLVDEALDGVARARAATHSSACARCRGLANDLRELRAEAGRLPVLRPSRDLWDGISARIETPPVSIDGRRVARWWAHPARLAAAAALLVAGTATVTWNVARQAPASQASQAGDAGGAGGEVTDTPVFALEPDGVVATPVSRVEAAYSPEIAELRALLAQSPRALDSVTARVIEDNLRIIDEAIARTRAALEAAPTNRLLAHQLARAYDAKLSTLRRIAAMPVEVSP